MLEKVMEYINKGGIIAVLVGILATGYQGYWVWGSTLVKAEADRDTWKALALKGTALAEDAAHYPRVIGMTPPAPTANTTPADVRSRLDVIEKELGK